MVRQTFIRKLRKIGEIPVPEGHLARNKGVSSYFFSTDKMDQLVELLSQEVGESTELQKPNPPGLVFVHRETYVKRRVVLYTASEKENFLIVSIMVWSDI
jgi:hypothetical protein